MKLKNILFLTLLFLVFLLPLVMADGGYFSDYHFHLYEPNQKAVISWDGKTETMILSAAVQSDDIANFAWIIPIQSSSKPIVTVSNISIFQELVDYFKPEVYYKGVSPGNGGAAATGGVVVIESKTIDIYNITILKTTSADDLINWLNNNGYKVPEEAPYIIVKYVDIKCTENIEDLYFIVNKIDLKNKHKDAIDFLTNFGLTDFRYYKIFDVYWNKEIPDSIKPKLRNLMDDLNDLSVGIGTPLKFEFQPNQPYYPLEISSINTGYTDIEVYVITNKSVEDANKILKVDKSKGISSDLKDKLKDHIDLKEATYVTRLTYKGYLNNLDDDAIFSNEIQLKSLGKNCWKDEECVSGNCDQSWSICCKYNTSCYVYENQTSCYNKCTGKEIITTTTIETTSTSVLTTTTIQQIIEVPQKPNIFIRIYQRMSNFFRTLLRR